MPSAYKWRPLPAGAFGHSVNPETIRRNQHRASLTPLETAFERARANRGNRLKQRRDFARKHDDYKALGDADKAEVDKAIIAEEDKALEQVRRAILADWQRYYPNQFDEGGVPLANPPIPVEVNSPPNSPAPPVNPSPKLRLAARMKSILDRVAKKRPRSPTSGSATRSPSEASPNIALHVESSLLATRKAASHPFNAGLPSDSVRPPPAIKGDNRFSTREAMSEGIGFGIWQERGDFRASNAESAQTSPLMQTGGEDDTSKYFLTKKDIGDLDVSFREMELVAKGGPMLDCAKPADWVLPNDELYEEWEDEDEDEDVRIIDISESEDENSNSLEYSDKVYGDEINTEEEDQKKNKNESGDQGERDRKEGERKEEARQEKDKYSQASTNSKHGDIYMTGAEETYPLSLSRREEDMNRSGFASSSGEPSQVTAQKRFSASTQEIKEQLYEQAMTARDFCGSSKEKWDRVQCIAARRRHKVAGSAQFMVAVEAAARKDAEHLGIDLEEMDRIDREMDRLTLLNAAR